MVRALVFRDQFNYVCKDDKDLALEDQTVWTLKNLTPKERAEIDDVGRIGLNDEVKEYSLNMGRMNLLALHIGLLGVSNFLDEDGQETLVLRKQAKLGALKYTEVEDNFLMKIPIKIQQELAQAIINSGELDEEEEKN